MITKAALLLFRESGGDTQLLFARPKGRSYWVFPGGKQEPNEAIESALQRELQEELGVGVSDVKKLGMVHGQTPDGRDMEMHLFTGELTGKPHPQAEIEAIQWFAKADVVDVADAMTPMTLNQVLPFLAARGIW
ncbi:MAG TPA: NUDIX domain-containing protein [Candidatus Saccharimonadales bacterium]|nr:NUDIX domain-containing protein [Candidatus Saccharimonadales bacterium]